MRLQVLHGWRVGARMPWERLRRALSTARPDPSHVDTRHAPQDFGLASAVVYSAFITETEGDSLVQDIESRMKRYVALPLICYTPIPSSPAEIIILCNDVFSQTTLRKGSLGCCYY